MLRLGILGGGQLGRMVAMAAAEYGIECHVFDPDPHCCAAQVAILSVGNFDDHDALLHWSCSLDAVTLEFENIPATSLEHLARYVPVRPGTIVLQKTQDRFVEKSWLQELGLSFAPFCPVDSAADLHKAASTLMGDLFLKTRTLGYDGKGQVRIKAGSSDEVLEQAFDKLSAPCIVEQAVDFSRELSLIIARNPAGQIVCLPLAENQHEDLPAGGKILRHTLAPAPHSQDDLTQQAESIGRQIAESCNLEGILAIEMFEIAQGALFINEMAPRPHNSGHWSIDGADYSQFHLLVRAALDLPLPERINYRPTRMTNILGDEAENPQIWTADGQSLHLYNKKGIKPGRKMGHINRIISD